MFSSFLSIYLMKDTKVQCCGPCPGSLWRHCMLQGTAFISVGNPTNPKIKRPFGDGVLLGHIPLICWGQILLSNQTSCLQTANGLPGWAFHLHGFIWISGQSIVSPPDCVTGCLGSDKDCCSYLPVPAMLLSFSDVLCLFFSEIA